MVIMLMLMLLKIEKISKSYLVDAEEETLEEVLGDSAFQEKPLVMDR